MQIILRGMSNKINKFVMVHILQCHYFHGDKKHMLYSLYIVQLVIGLDRDGTMCSGRVSSSCIV